MIAGMMQLSGTFLPFGDWKMRTIPRAWKKREMLNQPDCRPRNVLPPDEIPIPEEQANPDTFLDPAPDPLQDPPQDPLPPQPGDVTPPVHG